MHTLLLAAQAQEGGSYSFLIMMVLLFAIMWFFMVRPQQKRQKEIRNFQNALQPGTKVVTAGGIYGTVKSVDLEKSLVTVEVAKGIVLTLDKGSVYADASAMQPKQ